MSAVVYAGGITEVIGVPVAPPSTPAVRPPLPAVFPATFAVLAGDGQSFRPHDLLEKLEGTTKWQERSRMLEDFHQHLLCIPVSESRSCAGEVLLVLSRLLVDTNFKITLTTLYIIGDLVDRWASSMMTAAGAVVPGLVGKLGDNKIVIRQTAMKIFHKIFTAVVRLGSPQYGGKLLETLMGSLVNRATQLRYEVMSVIIVALVVFENGAVKYDREPVVQAMCQALQDPSERLSALAVEGLAVLQLAPGMGTVDERVSEVLQGNKVALRRAIARLDAGTLPRVTADGLLELPVTDLEVQRAAAELPVPVSPLRGPNGAVAVGRLGRKMFCLEDPSVSTSTPSQGSMAANKRSLALPGTSDTTDAGACKRSASIPGSGGAAQGQCRRSAGTAEPCGSPCPLRGARASSTSAAERGGTLSDVLTEDRPSRQSPGPLEVGALGCWGASRSSAGHLAKDRRRMQMQPLRVNFKDELPGEPTSVASGSAREWLVPIVPVQSAPLPECEVAALPVSSCFLRGVPLQEGSPPNYVPNWSRSVLRQPRGDRCLKEPKVGSFDEIYLQSPPLERAQPQLPPDEDGLCRLRNTPDVESVDAEDLTPSEISDRLKLLKRTSTGRTHSQGSARPSLLLLGSRSDVRSPGGQLPGCASDPMLPMCSVSDLVPVDFDGDADGLPGACAGVSNGPPARRRLQLPCTLTRSAAALPAGPARGSSTAGNGSGTESPSVLRVPRSGTSPAVGRSASFGEVAPSAQLGRAALKRLEHGDCFFGMKVMTEDQPPVLPEVYGNTRRDAGHHLGVLAQKAGLRQ